MSAAGDGHRSHAPRHPVRLVGLDAASQHSKFGYALGRLDPDTSTVVVEHAGLLGDADDPLRHRVAPFVRGGGRVLVAIDAPLGWPDGMRSFLGGHAAAGPPPADLAKDDCFRRRTDIAVRAIKLPLEVAADRIARAAFEALCVLRELRVLSQQPLALAWAPGFDGAASIEVYPGATLAARKLSQAPYKLIGQASGRAQILDALARARLIAELPMEARTRALANADVLDAILCMVAARDFLAGECAPPDETHLDQIKREGWIWVRRTAAECNEPNGQVQGDRTGEPIRALAPNPGE